METKKEFLPRNWCVKCQKLNHFKVSSKGSFCTVCNPDQLPKETLQKTVTDNTGTEKIGAPGAYPLYHKCICQYSKCRKEFLSKRSDAKTCGNKCRVAAAREKNKPTDKKIQDVKNLMLKILPDELAKAINRKIDEMIAGQTKPKKIKSTFL